MLQDLAIKVLVIAMMLAVGLDLSWTELRAGLGKTAALATGFAVNVLVIPLVVFALVSVLDLGAGVGVGLLIVAVAPGGPTGPLFTRIARADLGFATSLQVALCFAALLTAPLSLERLGGPAVGGASLLWPMTRTLAVYQLLPLCVGMVVRARYESLALQLAKPIGTIANALLLAIIVGLLATRGHILLEQPPSLHLLTCALVLAPLAVGFVAPGGRATMVAAGFVTTVRNLSVALLLSASFFSDDPTVDAVILVWGFYMMLLPALIAVWSGRARVRVEP